MPENQKLIIDQYHCWVICVYCHLKIIQSPLLFNILINNTPVVFDLINFFQIYLRLTSILLDFSKPKRLDITYTRPFKFWKIRFYD
jgi:hypothetical protein